jgi:hypothetical protein
LSSIFKAVFIVCSSGVQSLLVHTLSTPPH